MRLFLKFDVWGRNRYCFDPFHRTAHRRSYGPSVERARFLAQALWESIDAGLPDTHETGAIAEAIRRVEELSSGTATPRTHEQVMEAARRALE
ncbi:MAG TPA: addiction module protein [Pyrinomonadaceae bacterium]|nr:addiction module protein [Pyrinomonadaceae bacterium]